MKQLLTVLTLFPALPESSSMPCSGLWLPFRNLPSVSWMLAGRWQAFPVGAQPSSVPANLLRPADVRASGSGLRAQLSCAIALKGICLQLV